MGLTTSSPALARVLDPPRPAALTASKPTLVRVTGSSSFGDNTFGYGPFGGVTETSAYGMFDPPRPS
jgi:hypothetical protein